MLLNIDRCSIILLHFFLALYRFYLHSTLHLFLLCYFLCSNIRPGTMLVGTKNHKNSPIFLDLFPLPAKEKSVYIVFAFLELSCGIPVKSYQISK